MLKLLYASVLGINLANYIFETILLNKHSAFNFLWSRSDIIVTNGCVVTNFDVFLI